MISRETSDRSARLYPRKVDITRTIQAARANGISVGSIECTPDGTIRVSSEEPKAASPASTFDLWNEAGKL